ncbi:superoxide dismutase [Flavobacterium rakeshii]|uniref:Superoxide dismutase n=2 Tax=Flavobacteriaceae TaxID=49546 RepID=A0A6N8HA97_9FLAO|nr:superoxide dismutase [Flavobacterium rakeshii]
MKNVKMFFSALVLVASLQSCKEKNNLEEVQVPEPEKAEAPAMGNPDDVKAEGKFQLVKLGYAYDALEPYIDAKTMETHYSKHHVGYANKLNKAIAGSDLENKSIEEILKGMDMNNKALRNNGGGYYNHNLYWEIMAPNAGGQPTGALAEAINKDFGSFENFKDKFSEAAGTQFGSGWAWLYVDASGKLAVGQTPNQDNPLMPGVGISGTPVLAIDVWEHAYYLHYQNKRPDYISNFYNVINWDAVAKKYEAAIAK